MKLSKKRVLVIALVVCLVAILSMGTLAWFNYTDDITNKFMVATDSEGTPDFGLDIWETENDGDDTVDADGDGDPIKTQEGNTYEDITPGDVLAKDPTVENTGHYDQWVRVLVTFDEYSKIEAACTRVGISTDLRQWLDIDTANWTADDAATFTGNDTITYVFYYNSKLTEGATAALFSEITIPGAFEQEDMAYVSGDFSVTVKADAVQADNTGDTAQAAFAAVGWTAGEAYDA
ncbi:MAG: hypothetical protein J6J43_00160 [Oscillospiraceae bacterium]|nr:hypothetical protein [Oscillospiraceae bacterium]